MNCTAPRLPVRDQQTDVDVLAIASTGRTATSYIAEALNMLPGMAALHEGHLGNDAGPDILPMVNLDNFQCYKSATRAAEVVAAKRSAAVLDEARRALGVGLLVDVAYYNSVLLAELLEQVPDAHGAIIVRDCETFVRSATWFTGTDPMPVGWPDPAKELDARERFIGMGRLRPHTGSDVEAWTAWGAIERNIWLWRTTNAVLCDAWERHPGKVHHIDFGDFTRNPTAILGSLLTTIGVPLEEAALGELERALVEARSRQNERLGGYQVGSADSWTADQQRLLDGRRGKSSVEWRVCVAEGLVDEVVAIVGSVLAARGAGDVAISVDSGMGNPPAWDSLAFVEIFTTVSERLGLDVSDDDAINFMTVREIVDFVAANRG